MWNERYRSPTMIRVLINSYACCPNMGSEPGMGWNWIVSLAKYCECFVISEGEFRPQVEEWLSISENEAIASKLHFYWLPIGGNNVENSARIRKMCWNQGDWRFYFYYKRWQKKAARKADEIIAHQPTNIPIQILHQLNMIGFREPGYLWWVAQKHDMPLVWGPIDAKDGFPMEYARNTSINVKAFLFLKNVITRLQLRFMPRVLRMANQSDILFSASSDSQHSISHYWHKQSVLMNETGCSLLEIPMRNLRINNIGTSPIFNIMWCGKMDFRKQLDLAIRAVAESQIPNAVLHVVGDGDNAQYKQLAEQLKVQTIWYGRQPHDEVQKIMQNSDVLLFTSVAEGTPHVITEALANGLPVICHKTCGQGDVIDERVGITCQISTPNESVIGFASALKKLHEHPDLLKQLSEGCVSRAKEITWEKKAQEMVIMYKQYC